MSDPRRSVPPWTFDATGFGALLTVLDGGELGDIYNVFDFGTLIGATSFVVPDEYSCGGFPEPCLADPLMSKGFFELLPGPHSITISINSTPYPDSFLSWFRVQPLAEPPGAVPEPKTLMMIAAGFLGMGMLRYRPRHGGR